MNLNYYNFLEGRKKEVAKSEKRKQEFLGIRRQERERVLGELWKDFENCKTISNNALKEKIDELIEKDFEKPRRFC